jgi:outer membrane protein insertion porin family
LTILKFAFEASMSLRFRAAASALWLCILLISLIASPVITPARAADVISAIEVAGNQSVDANSIRSHVPLRPGTAYDAGKADQAIKALFATGWFSDVRLRRRGSVLVITVVENPVVRNVTFEGASAIDKAKLKDEVELKPGARFSVAKAHAGAVKLRELYKRAGRLTTTVEMKTEPKGEGSVDLTFMIKEGEVNKVDSIQFRGNRAFSDSQLRDVISTSQSGWFDFLKSAAFYDPERLDLDRHLLRRHYLKNGYPDVAVSAAEVVKNEAGTGYRITFPVDEGERYTFGGVSVESKVEGLDTSKLAALPAAKAGEAYNQDAIEKSEDKLMLALAEAKQPFARVRIVPARDPQSRTVGVKFQLEEGPHLYLERIEIAGNTKTKDHVIRRELGLAEGDPVNVFLLERAKARIQKLGFFKTVTFKQKRGSAPDRVELRVEVVEEETIDLAFGAGYSSSEGIIGDVSITERNLFGNGQWLRLKLAGSQERLQADIGFTEPRFLGTRMAAGFDLFYKDVDYLTQSSYKAQRIGGDVRLTAPLSDETSLGLNYTLSRNRLYDVGENASPAIKEAASAADGTYYTSSIGYSLTYDTRNSKKLPTSGVITTVSQDIAGLGGDVRFIRSVGEARGYYALTDSVTLMGRAQGGTIVGWGGDDVRLLDLFYKGGETVRGFARGGIGPRDLASVNSDALGGTSFYAATAEAMFAIPGVTESTGLRGAVFADAGSLWGLTTTSSKLSSVSGNSASPRVSTGVGIAWDSPLGPLRLDYAIPLLKQAADKTQPLSFGLSPF